MNEANLHPLTASLLSSIKKF